MNKLKFLKPIIFLIALFALSGSTIFAQEVKISTKEEIKASVEAVPCKQDERLDGVKKLFLDAGAKEDAIKTEEFKKGKITNLVVIKKGTTDETVIIGAHYDRTSSGCGVVDNWTGLVVMAHIYRSMAPMVTKKTYKFVAFDQEEMGLKGSSQMVKAMTPEELKSICSMINFDSFGQAAPMALRSVASPKMIKLASDIGKEGGLNFQDVEIPGASADSASFIDKKIPAITISGLAGNWQEILHTSNDKIGAVNMDSVYLGYRFGLVFTAKVEAAGCSDFQ